MNQIEKVEAPWSLEIEMPDTIFYRSKIHGKERYYFTVNEKMDRAEFFVGTTSWIKEVYPPSPFLIKWYKTKSEEEIDQILEDTSSYGTFFHEQVNKFVRYGEYDMDNAISDVQVFCEAAGLPVHYWWADKVCNDMLSLNQLFIEKEIKPIASEIVLHSREPFLRGGSCDFVCEMTFNRKRVVAIIDFKTGQISNDPPNTNHHAAQLYDYRKMWNELYPDIPVEMVFNWSPTDWRKNPTSGKLVNQTSDEVEAMYHRRLEDAAMMYGGDIKSVRRYGGTLKPGVESGDYDFQSAEEYIIEMMQDNDFTDE